ncbi:cytochrome P450 2 sub U member 1 [Bulinus truncatus]|nr:cytochrome P450 2 sub U member 1 [Bulinus truncatus]
MFGPPYLDVYSVARIQKKKPPSPGMALPIIGHLHLLEKNPRNQFLEWAKKLGDIFHLQMGSHSVYVLNNLDLIKEAFIKKGDVFSDRPVTFINRTLPNGFKGVLFSSGANWKEQRTVTLSILKSFGLGKNILAEKISEEVLILKEEIAKNDGQAFDMRNVFNVCVSNIVSSIVFGKRFEFDDSVFEQLVDNLSQIVRLTSGTSILNFLPALRHLPLDLFKSKKLRDVVLQQRYLIGKMVNDIRSRQGSGNFIITYVDEMEKKKAAGEETYLDDTNLARVVDNLFSAGTETTSSTMLWCILYSLHYPEMQRNIHDEIFNVIGADRSPTIFDKTRLNYLNAFIMETQRMASIVPFSLVHITSQDTSLAGYGIPKGAQVISNLDAVLKDERVWKDPENFRPERFLDGSGAAVQREWLVPFGVGRRVCLGESLAKMELFIFLANLFQTFEFLPEDPENLPPLTDVFGLTVAPKPYKVRCIKRKYLKKVVVFLLCHNFLKMSIFFI